jgi:hypothetical protein
MPHDSNPRARFVPLWPDLCHPARYLRDAHLPLMPCELGNAQAALAGECRASPHNAYGRDPTQRRTLFIYILIFTSSYGLERNIWKDTTRSLRVAVIPTRGPSSPKLHGIRMIAKSSNSVDTSRHTFETMPAGPDRASETASRPPALSEAS